MRTQRNNPEEMYLSETHRQAKAAYSHHMRMVSIRRRATEIKLNHARSLAECSHDELLEFAVETHDAYLDAIADFKSNMGV